MYTLKSVARRGSMLGAAFAVVASMLIPAASVFADALNPLTERSLLLSSSAPGYTDTDGSGNATGSDADIPDGTYAQAGTGANGKKTGETFTFKVSSTANVKSFTLQYCTSAAGLCQAPGNNTGDSRTLPTPDRETNAVAHAAGRSDLDAVFSGLVPGVDFEVNYSEDNGQTYSPLPNLAQWEVTTANAEDEDFDDTDTEFKGLTGKRNYIGVRDTSGTGYNFEQTNVVQIKFNASESDYITNPGKGSFFVKINTYGVNTIADWTNVIPYADNTNIIDGGVTVANVMTDSIHITTKVLETMSFSVGTRNRDTVTLNCATYDAQPADPDYDDWLVDQAAGCEAATGAIHGTCDAIQNVNNNRLSLGDPNAEYSLRTDRAYDVSSYWRLSSNSSGGASVYYSGNTLANTVGDEIAQVGPTAAVSTPGTEQFGLAFTDISEDDYSTAFDTLVTNDDRYKNPTLELASGINLAPVAGYADYTAPASGGTFPAGFGRINTTDTEVDGNGTAINARFAFQKISNTEPVLIAQNNDMVISCATAKMRYLANIGADTPAGVYTTKINYLAAPQY